MIRNLNGLVKRAVEGKTILVTGATGSVGAELVETLLHFNPRVLRLLDHNEERSFYAGLRYQNNPRVRVLLGDIRDRERMKRSIQDVDILFHAAALKHVGMGEYNPFEVVETNLVALQHLIECSIDADIGRFIFMSSDKAVNPTNVMGGSKFIGERLITAGNLYKGRKRTIFASTRFGNVFGSAGSVVPVFRRQILAGGPVTITDPSMTRFFMTLREAVDLLLACLVTFQGGEVFVPKMHAIRLVDLASAMIERLSPGRPIPTKTIGLRRGEKRHEELISENELPRCLETQDLLIVLPFPEESGFKARSGQPASALGPGDYSGNPRWAKNVYSSKHAIPMSRGDVAKLVRFELSLPENAE